MHTLEHPVLGPLRLGVSRLESSREFFGLLLGLGLRDTPEGLEIRLPSGATLATLEERPEPCRIPPPWRGSTIWP